MSRRSRSGLGSEVSVGEALISRGLQPDLAEVLGRIPHRVVEVDSRRPFREPGVERNEVFFVAQGIISKYRTDGAGRRQIIALRFAGDGILPRDSAADYGIQAIVRSKVAVGQRADFEALIDTHPELARFFWKLTQRHAAIGYEWLLNCGRRDSVARVAHLLCETAERSGIDAVSQRMINPFTQQQIADITGQTSVNVNRVLADLERQSLIRREGREIIFQDWNELRRVASFSPNYLQ
ncbi:Crp/Fnr family transcriptional regulator [Sphingomonas rosea]|jgi:CRP-like cAMP-binding protein|uniref:Crp/Fnr family transcriptional regulator n=1 Tax=Sphingomonas rosea TaxID=335605 RepID=A0ABP7UFK4_9SPHN